MKEFCLKCMTVLMTVAFIFGITSGNAFAASDWAASGNYIEVIGQGMAPVNARNATHARMLARRAAVADGYRQLAEAVKGVEVESGTSVDYMMIQSDDIKLRVNTVIKGAQVVSEREISGGGYEVTMRMPIFGAENSLAKAVMPAQPQVRETFPAPTKTIQSSGGYTGLIVDCRGLGLKPVMSPVIKNNNGQPIYGYKNLDPDKVIAQGMANYCYNTSDTSASRAGSNPLIVKAVALDGVYNGNPVVSTDDANRILAENNVAHFLENTNVVFIR